MFILDLHQRRLLMVPASITLTVKEGYTYSGGCFKTSFSKFILPSAARRMPLIPASVPVIVVTTGVSTFLYHLPTDVP